MMKSIKRQQAEAFVGHLVSWRADGTLVVGYVEKSDARSRSFTVKVESRTNADGERWVPKRRVTVTVKWSVIATQNRIPEGR